MASILTSGCSTPNNANITLRKQIDELNTKIESLNRRHDADQATIAGLKQGATTVPSLSDTRVSELFTTHGLKFGRLTSGSDEGLKVYVVPIDDEGQQLKAAGTFDIDAFDLAQNGENRLGHWTFDVNQTRQSWYGAAMLYTYLLKCPWQTKPQHDTITIRVTFTDALTGRKFTQQREVQIKKSQPVF